MRVIKVIFEDGNFLTTEINGTNEEILKYYVGQYFEFDESKPSVKATEVKFLDEVCYHCKMIFSQNPVTDNEFHQDGVYCSKECLEQEMKDVEAWNEDFNGN